MNPRDGHRKGGAAECGSVRWIAALPPHYTAGAQIALSPEVVGTLFGRRARRGNGTLWAVVIVRVLELHRCGFAARDRDLLKHLGQRVGFEHREIPAFLALPRCPAEQ